MTSEDVRVGRAHAQTLETSQSVPLVQLITGVHSKSLRKFASVHAYLHNHFSQDRHLIESQTYKRLRSVALAEWQNLMA